MAIDSSDTLSAIERQLDKIRSTADSLGALSAMPGLSAVQAKKLSDQAVEFRLKQFQLYRKKDRILASSNEWKAIVASMEVVNERIERAIEDQRKLSEVISTAATALSVIVRLIGIVGAI